MQYPKERRFTNRRGQRPYPGRHNADQESSSWRSGNGNFQSHSYNDDRNPYAYGGESSHYSKKDYRNTEGEFFKTNAYQRRQLPQDKYKSHYSRNSMNRDFRSYSHARDSQPTTSYHPPEMDMPLISPEEVKALKLMNAVQSQNGIGSLLVLLQTEKDNATVVIQNALQSIRNGVLTVVPGTKPQNFELRINGELVVEGEFLNKQVAKNALCELALDVLKKTCFLIIKRKNYEEISTEDLNKSKADVPTSSSLEGSKAHRMMLKMGWGGKGLGVNEQGAEKTVAETMTQNVTKEGLGGKNIMSEISRILEEFGKSAKVTTLAFDSGFTKEERAHIHNLAAKFNLRSKSEGKGDDRRITIGKKIAKWDLVKELLVSNCENDAYKLIIPSDFESIWTDE